MLGKLIDHVGLEDAAELVALATTEQLVGIFDEDLWRSARPGEDERFDSERFLLWLEILAEAGDAAVAARLAELPPDLLTLAVHRHVFVLALDELRAELTAGDDDAEAAEKAFESCLTEELEGFQLIWRGGDGWDAMLSALLAFDRDHHDLCQELLERCASLSREHIEDEGGLYAVLSSEDMLETDLGAEREARRGDQGYVAPSAAAAFLKAALGQVVKETPYTEHDPTTRAYFRDFSAKLAPLEASSISRGTPPGQSPRSDLLQLLGAAGITQAQPRGLLGGGGRAEPAEPLVITALRALLESAPARFAERSEELAYVTNALLSGASVDGRQLRPVDAVEHALTCVSYGLEVACGIPQPTPSAAADQLAAHPADGLFRLALVTAQHSGPALGDKSSASKRSAVVALVKRLRV